jgi:thiol:disulfide interchange protein DsbC
MEPSVSRYLAALTLVIFGAGANLRAAPVDQQPGNQPPANQPPAEQQPGEQPPGEQPPADPRAALLKLLPAGTKLDDLQPSPIPGIYEFMQGAEISYLTADGKYFIDGNLYDMKSRDNLTEALRTHARVALINAVPESQMLIFSPANPKYTLTVFTDVDCQYCRKLHSDMAELNRLGIRVRYMFFPRTGPGTESWRKAEVVWCSPNRLEALTRAKLGAVLDMNKTCGSTPVAREYALGESIGIRGTPAMFSEYGDLINGYLPPQQLALQLRELQLAKR